MERIRAYLPGVHEQGDPLREIGDGEDQSEDAPRNVLTCSSEWSEEENAHQVCDEVKEAGAPLALVHVGLADEVLLRVARNLRGRARLHVRARDAAPVALAQLLQAQQKQPVLLLGPRDPWDEMMMMTSGAMIKERFNGYAKIFAKRTAKETILGQLYGAA